MRIKDTLVMSVCIALIFLLFYGVFDIIKTGADIRQNAIEAKASSIENQAYSIDCANSIHLINGNTSYLNSLELIQNNTGCYEKLKPFEERHWTQYNELIYKLKIDSKKTCDIINNNSKSLELINGTLTCEYMHKDTNYVVFKLNPIKSKKALN